LLECITGVYSYALVGFDFITNASGNRETAAASLLHGGHEFWRINMYDIQRDIGQLIYDDKSADFS
jgi:hypothetical protein